MIPHIDPDLLPQALPEGWVPGAGRSMGAWVVSLYPLAPEYQPDAWRLLADELPVDDLGNLYVTSVIKIAGPAARTLLDDMVEAARPYLIEEVQQLVPQFLLALGADAYRALTGLTHEMSLYRGNWQHLDEAYDWEGALVMPTWSPDEVLARPSARGGQFRRDLTEFARAWAAESHG